MSGPTTVGSIDAKLTVDDSDFKRGMTEAKAEAKEVGALEPEVKVDANVGPALAKLDAVKLAERDLDVAYQRTAISEEKLSQISKKYGEDSVQAASARLTLTRATNAESDAEAKLSGLRQKASADIAKETVEEDKNTAATNRGNAANKQRISGIGVLIALSPALLAAAAPIAASAVGLGAAFGVMGVAGVLAVKGIKDAMVVGDTVGNTYATGLGILKDDLDKLAATSANGMLSGFSSAVGDINSRMPFLTQMTGQFSGMLGQIGGTALRGVLDGLQQMNPLIQTGGIELSKFVTWLTSFTSTNGFQQFITYAIDNLPSVMNLIESLVTTAGHILAAFAPLGPVVIGFLTALSDGLSSLPTPVLAGLVTTATTVAPALNLAATAMGWFGVESSLAIPVVGILVAALAGIGVAAATAAAGTDMGTVSMTDYGNAVERDNGLIGENVRLQAAHAATTKEMRDAADSLGVSTETVMQAMLGNKDALAQVNAATQLNTDRISANQRSGEDLIDTGKRMDDAGKTLTSGIQNNSSAIQNNVDAHKAYKDITEKTTPVMDAQTKAAQAQADAYGTTVAGLQAAKTAQESHAQAAAAATLQMQLENDAAGLLKQAFDTLNGKTLNVEQANTRAAAAANTAAKSFQQNGLAIAGTTDAAIANQQALQNKVTADQAAADAISKSTGSTEKGTAAYAASKKALEDQLKAQGLLTPAIQDYIDKLYGIPASAKTQVELDKQKAEAALALWKQEVEDATRRRTQYIDVITNRIDKSTQDPGGSGSSTGGRANGSLAGGAATGGLIHSGFSASSPAYLSEGGSPFVPRGTDTIPAMLTPGEIVMKRASVASLGAGNLLEANRTGQWPAQAQQQAQLPPIYIQNPFTGEYLLAQVDGRVGAGISAANSDAGRRPAR